MFSCIFIKRKLYAYLDNALSEIEKIKVKKHLDICLSCQEKLSQMADIIDLAKNRKIPQPSEDFWHNFKIELDRKLNTRLVPEFSFQRNLNYHLRPVFVYASVLVFILAMSLYLYYKPTYLTRSDLDLINEVNLLEEVTSDASLNHSEDMYIEELNLLYQLNQDITPS